MKTRTGWLGDLPIEMKVAEGPWERMRGLLARSPLVAGQGLLIQPCNMVHTWGMRYPLDLVFVSRPGRILQIAAHVHPRRVRACWGARAVIELPPGDVERRALEPGMTAPEQLMADGS